jgi:hypothetical protein
MDGCMEIKKNTCVECKKWCGRCTDNIAWWSKVGKIAVSEACYAFEKNIKET